jgi:hypothetical protein
VSELNHERDFQAALEHIEGLCKGEVHSEGVTIGRIMEVVQAALWNAKMSNETFADITSGQMIFQRRLEHLARAKHS